MTIDDDRIRAKALSERIRQRTDITTRNLVNALQPDQFDYTDRTNLLISELAWQHVVASNIQPHNVFAHPELLEAHPEASLYYRGLALLSLKRVGRVAAVKDWETRSRTRPIPLDRALSVCRLYNSVISSIIEGASHWTLDTRSRTRPIPLDRALSVCRLYNSVISSIIEGASHWTLDNGYRNILSNMGITLDGMFRNVIGRDAEEFIKTKTADWLRERNLIVRQSGAKRFELPQNTLMVYGSEPDILFEREKSKLATIEIKGGKDPAGALERLGAMQKSFTETPVRCKNILIAGVVTPSNAVATRPNQCRSLST